MKEQVFKRKDEVSNIAANFKEMNKNHADIKEELSTLKKNVDRKTLDTIKKLDSSMATAIRTNDPYFETIKL